MVYMTYLCGKKENQPENYSSLPENRFLLAPKSGAFTFKNCVFPEYWLLKSRGGGGGGGALQHPQPLPAPRTPISFHIAQWTHPEALVGDKDKCLFEDTRRSVFIHRSWG